MTDDEMGEGRHERMESALTICPAREILEHSQPFPVYESSGTLA